MLVLTSCGRNAIDCTRHDVSFDGLGAPVSVWLHYVPYAGGDPVGIMTPNIDKSEKSKYLDEEQTPRFIAILEEGLWYADEASELPETDRYVYFKALITFPKNKEWDFEYWGFGVNRGALRVDGDVHQTDRDIVRTFYSPFKD